MYSLCENLFKLQVIRSKFWVSCALKFTKTFLYNLFFSLLGNVGFLNYSKSRSTISTMIRWWSSLVEKAKFPVFFPFLETMKDFQTTPVHWCNVVGSAYDLRGKCRCPSLSCPLDRLPPGGQANHGWLAPRGATCPGISYPPPWLPSPPGGNISRLVYLAPRGWSQTSRVILPPTHELWAVTVQKFWNCY